MKEGPPYTPGLKEVLRYSRNEATRLGHDYIGPEHLLLGIIRKGDGMAIQTLLNLNVDLEDLRIEMERILQVGKSIPNLGMLSHNEASKLILENSHRISAQMKHPYVGTEHLLLAILKDTNNLASKCMRNFNVTYEKATVEALNVLEGNVPGFKQIKSPSPEKAKTPALDTFGRDLTALAREGKLDPVIGREDEIERILQILCRRTKNNPILLGEPGVGKTAIVEGLAQNIVNEEVPELLCGKKVLSLDLAAVVAGTKYRGQFEERLKAIMTEIRKTKDVLIFIDELHTLVGAGAAEGAIDASNMLKPALSRGEIQCIGATTIEEYRKYIEKDGALERRFQTLMINPPTVDQTIDILKGLRSRYEAHHNVVISDDAVNAAAMLSDRYVTDRYLPDKAIDLIDETGSRARLLANIKPPEIKELEVKINAYEEEIRSLAIKQEFEKCAEIKLRKEETINEKSRMFNEWQHTKNDKSNVKVITKDDISYIVSKWTGIPLTKVEEEETHRLLNIESELGDRIVSQEEAIHSIAKAIRRSRSGLKDPRRPMGSFMFLGPTGVGKTELAKALAEVLFGNSEALIRIDMSEYTEKFSLSRMLGAPPGYVGYEEGGQLTEKVRQKPYSVILLDEIEKAHPDIFNILLQVLDEGHLTDSWGHVVDFKNTVLIITSNVGTSKFKIGGSIGFGGTDIDENFENIKKSVLDGLKKEFKPEFLNRIDDIIVFKYLSEEDISKIIDILLVQTNKKLKEKNITVEIDEETRNFLIREGFNHEYGARHLKRAIQNNIEDPLSIHIIDGSVPSNCKVSIIFDTGKLLFIPRAHKEKETVKI